MYFLLIHALLSALLFSPLLFSFVVSTRDSDTKGVCVGIAWTTTMSVVLSIARTVKKKKWGVVVVVKMVKMVKISCFHFSCFFALRISPGGLKGLTPHAQKNKEKEFGCFFGTLHSSAASDLSRLCIKR